MSEPQRLLDRLASIAPEAHRTTLRRALAARRVTVNGAVEIAASRSITNDDEVVLHDASQTPPPTGANNPPALPHGVTSVFQDDDVWVVDKPPGLITSSGSRDKRTTLLKILRKRDAGRGDGKRDNDRVGLIHRLDADARGLLVFSRNHAAFRSLKQQFFEHTVERVYLAVVHGVPTPRDGRIEGQLLERADGTVVATNRPAPPRAAKGRSAPESAALFYRTLERRRRTSLLEVTLETGRKHQIRVQLQTRAVPIVNDRVYGPPDVRVTGDLLLTATRLSFDHPRTRERLTFERPVPDDFVENLSA